MWSGFLFSRFGWVERAWRVQCADGSWGSFAPPPLLLVAGLPLALLAVPIAGRPLRQKALFAAWTSLAIGAITLGAPFTTIVGVCLTPARVTAVGLFGSRAAELAELQEARRVTTLLSDRFVLGDLVIPLRGGLGRGGARDPEALAEALVDAFHRAGAPP